MSGKDNTMALHMVLAADRGCMGMGVEMCTMVDMVHTTIVKARVKVEEVFTKLLIIGVFRARQLSRTCWEPST